MFGFLSCRRAPADAKRCLRPWATGETGTESSCFKHRCCPAGRLKGVSKIPDSWKCHQSSGQHNKPSFQSSDFYFHPSPASIKSVLWVPPSPTPLLLLLVVVVLLQRLLQFGGDLLEEVDLLTEVVLHLGSEVPYPRAVEVLDLCQRGAGDDVAAVMELALLLGTVLHLGQSTWRGGHGAERTSVTPLLTPVTSTPSRGTVNVTV